MKKILFIITMLLSIHVFGQKLVGKIPGLQITNGEIPSKNDTIIDVIYKMDYKKRNSRYAKAAYFINGNLVNESAIRTINQNEIATLNIEKKNIEIENVKYNQQFYLVTKSAYNPKFITLNHLKLKYTNLKDNSTIFKIDNEIINDNYDSFLVDEKNILKIIVEKFENEKEKLNINFIHLITKTEENIKKANSIIIRGNNEFVSNK